MPRPLQCQYFEAQSHTPFDCCVRFVVVVTFHAATLATRRTLLPTWAGLAPAGSRQLRLAHHHLLLAGLPAHLCENTGVHRGRRKSFSISRSESQKFWWRYREKAIKKNHSPNSWLAHVFTQAQPIAAVRRAEEGRPRVSSRPGGSDAARGRFPP